MRVATTSDERVLRGSTDGNALACSGGALCALVDSLVLCHARMACALAVASCGGDVPLMLYADSRPYWGSFLV
eukprot:12629413-Alexandrium_andersonii.AAC.1